MKLKKIITIFSILIIVFILLTNVEFSFAQVDIIPPDISFISPPTPLDDSYLKEELLVEILATDEGKGDNNISAFIDFNNSLISWWRMGDDNIIQGSQGHISGVNVYQTYSLEFNDQTWELHYTPNNAGGSSSVIGQEGWVVNPNIGHQIGEPEIFIYTGFGDERIFFYTTDHYYSIGADSFINGVDGLGGFQVNLDFSNNVVDYKAYLVITTITDYMNNNHGTAEGSIGLVDGAMGKAMGFDGNSYVQINSQNNIPLGSDSRTHTLWLKAETHEMGYVFGIEGGQDGKWFMINWENNAVSLTMGGHRVSTPVGQLNDNTWYHVVVRVPDGSTSTDDPEIFINGVLQNLTVVGGANYPHNLDTIINYFVIGGHPTIGNKFKGIVDDIMVFSRALSVEEIQSLYANSISKSLEMEYSDLEDGSYNIKAYAQDKGGNINYTESRNITIDSVPPVVSIDNMTPEDGSKRSENNIPIKAFIEDESRVSSFIDLNDSLMGWWTFEDEIEITENVFPRGSHILAFTDAYNGSSYGFGETTNIQQEIDNSMRWDDRASITKVSRINSWVSQRDYVSLNIASPLNETRVLSFWYYGTYGSQIRPYNNDSSANLYYLNSEGEWEGGETGSTGVIIPVTINQWQKITIKVENRGISAGTGISWMILHNNAPQVSLANTHHWSFTLFQYEERDYATLYTPSISYGVFGDYSGNERHGYLEQNHGVSRTSGYFGRAMHFDGQNSFVNFINDDFAFGDDDSFSISVWAKTSNNDIFLGAYRYHLSRSEFRTRGSNELQVNTGISDENWNLITITYDGSGSQKILTAFVNGIQVGQDSTFGSPLSSNTYMPLIMGKTYHSNGIFAEVILDDIMIFNRALSAQEISKIYSDTSSGYLEINYDNLLDGNYSFRIISQDRASNITFTDRKELEIDTVEPLISFEEPTPEQGSSLTDYNITARVSASDEDRGDNKIATFIELGDSLISWLRMEEVVENTVIDQMNKNHGTNVGATRTTLGYFGKAFEFRKDEEELLMDYRIWEDGQTGTVGQFTQWSTGNSRVIAEDPWGREVVVWKSGERNPPDATHPAQGGIYHNAQSIDNTKLYRMSWWEKRVTNAGATSARYYAGLHGYGSVNGVINLSAGTYNTNPYFWNSNAVPTQAQLPVEEWVLIVGHIFPYDHTGTSRHSDSGRYTINGFLGDTNVDFKWAPETTTARSRTLAIYQGNDPGIVHYTVYPRLDVVDGTEPSIGDLLNGFDNYGDDIEIQLNQEEKSISFWYREGTSNIWYHIVNSNGTYYRNGNTISPAFITYPIYLSGNKVHVGRTPTSRFFKGTIDEVMIFNRELSSAEVLALYANSSSKYLQKDFYYLTEGQHTLTAYVQDEAGNLNSTERTFEVIHYPATIRTHAATNVDLVSATLRGIVTDTGGPEVTSVYFQWGTSSGVYGFDNRDTAETKTGLGLFSKEISGLDPDTIYYFRAITETGKGISYGEEKIFLTTDKITINLEVDGRRRIIEINREGKIDVIDPAKR